MSDNNSCLSWPWPRGPKIFQVSEKLFRKKNIRKLYVYSAPNVDLPPWSRRIAYFTHWRSYYIYVLYMYNKCPNFRRNFNTNNRNKCSFVILEFVLCDNSMKMNILGKNSTLLQKERDAIFYTITSTKLHIYIFKEKFTIILIFCFWGCFIDNLRKNNFF